MMPLPPRRIPRSAQPRKSARQRALADWRGIDLAPEEKTRAPSAISAAAVMPGVLKTLRIDTRRAEAEVVKVWNELLDPVITAHAQPVGLNKGTLFVNVDSSAWLSEIVRYRRKEILDRLHNSFGREFITRISFRAG
jgi:hypothetical protein